MIKQQAQKRERNAQENQKKPINKKGQILNLYSNNPTNYPHDRMEDHRIQNTEPKSEQIVMQDYDEEQFEGDEFRWYNKKQREKFQNSPQSSNKKSNSNQQDLKSDRYIEKTSNQQAGTQKQNEPSNLKTALHKPKYFPENSRLKSHPDEVNNLQQQLNRSNKTDYTNMFKSNISNKFTKKKGDDFNNNLFNDLKNVKEFSESKEESHEDFRNTKYKHMGKEQSRENEYLLNMQQKNSLVEILEENDMSYRKPDST